MVELQIKTLCGKPLTGTNDDLLFTFCNSDQCCSTGGLQLTNAIQGSNGYAVDCNTPDIFGSSQIGDCKNFEFGSKSIVTGKVTLTNIDGFRGEWVKIRSSDGSFFQCTIDGWIDGDNNILNESNVPIYQNFSCTANSSLVTANSSKDDANCTTVLVESYNTTEVYIEGNCSTCHQTKVVHKTYKGKLLIAIYMTDEKTKKLKIYLAVFSTHLFCLNTNSSCHWYMHSDGQGLPNIFKLAVRFRTCGASKNQD